MCVCDVCACLSVCMYVWRQGRTEEHVRCPLVSVSTALRRELLLNLELWWGPASLKEPPVANSAVWSYRTTQPCPAFPSASHIQAQLSCLHCVHLYTASACTGWATSQFRMLFFQPRSLFTFCLIPKTLSGMHCAPSTVTGQEEKRLQRRREGTRTWGFSRDVDYSNL